MEEPLTIGIIGGMSPESTVFYYQHIVRRHQGEFRDHSYPRIVIVSVSFEKYIGWQHEGDWARIARELGAEFRRASDAGADFALLATNTMHKVLPIVDSPVPVLSILDAVGRHAKESGVKRLGLTGTKFTMEGGFYAEGLERHGLSVLIPSHREREAIQRIIYDELIFGKVEPSSEREFSEIAEALAGRGAEAILLGCTELNLLTGSRDGPVRFMDSTRIHADAAWEVATGVSAL